MQKENLKEKAVVVQRVHKFFGLLKSFVKQQKVVVEHIEILVAVVELEFLLFVENLKGFFVLLIFLLLNLTIVLRNEMGIC